MANIVDPDQTAPIGAVCSGSTLFASILNLSVMLGKYLQQMNSPDDIFRCIFILGALRVKQSGLKMRFGFPESCVFFSLTHKVPPIICSRREFQILLLFKKITNKA